MLFIDTADVFVTDRFALHLIGQKSFEGVWQNVKIKANIKRKVLSLH